MRGKCLNPEFFWSVISRIRTKERDLLFILYLVRIQKNTDHKNSEIVQFSRSFVGVTCKFSFFSYHSKLLNRKISCLDMI